MSQKFEEKKNKNGRRKACWDEEGEKRVLERLKGGGDCRRERE